VSSGVAQVSIGTVLAISAAVHVGAILWISEQPHEDRRVPFALPTLPTIPPKDPEPTIVVLLDDHTPVATTGHGRGGSGRIGKSHAVAVSTQATEQGSSEVKSGPSSSLMSMRGGNKPSLEHGGLSGDFTSTFLANSKPLPAPLEKSGQLRPHGQGTKSEHRTFNVKVAPDGTVAIHDRPNVQLEGGHVSFDVTDALMRSKGIDPYAAYKMKVLDETREERYEAGKQYRTQQLARSREIMNRNIARLVGSTPDREALKQGLFELWDDCAESGPDELVVAGKAAREQVMAYIRGHLSYSTEELAQLNKRRRSQLPFAP
jgi:hypothetical protein